MAEVDWAALPEDILGLISKQLTFDTDYSRFRSVCPSWRSSAPKRPQLPWLIGHREHRDTTIFSFFRFSFQGDEMLLIPVLPESRLLDGSDYYGSSSHGWIQMVGNGNSGSTVLSNPLTKSNIQLPAHSLKHFGFKDVGEEFLVNQVIFSSDPALSSNCVALAVVDFERLAFCWSGDKSWTPIRCPPHGLCVSQVGMYEGKFYVASYEEVYVCNLGRNPEVKLVASIGRDQTRGFYIDEAHLVESAGDFFLVLAFYSNTNGEGHRFTVFKFVWGEQVELVELKNLGGRALFLDNDHSFSFAASSIPGCRSNSVYYISEDKTLGRCNFDDGSTVSLLSEEAIPHPDWSPCFWFKPSLLS